MNLYLIRHGHTSATDGGIAAGRTDVPLNAAGRKAVSALGNRLRALLTSADVDWYASPLKRTRESAELLQAVIGAAPISLDERLVELDFGEWEGRAWEDIHRENPEAMSYWAEDWVNRAPPGGECFAEQQARCGQWLDDRLGNARDAIVVVHGGTIRALTCTLLGWPATDAMSFPVDPASLHQFHHDEVVDEWRAGRFNETGELDVLPDSGAPSESGITG